MNPRYLPTDLEGKIDRLVEESGEVLQVIGKIGRFGLTSAHPKGGPNNASLLLSEMADLRHAISVVENEITDHAKIVVNTPEVKTELVWTNELISTREMRELICDEECETDEDFNSEHTEILVCEGEWRREGFDWRFYKDPDA